MNAFGLQITEALVNFITAVTLSCICMFKKYSLSFLHACILYVVQQVSHQSRKLSVSMLLLDWQITSKNFPGSKSPCCCYETIKIEFALP